MVASAQGVIVPGPCQPLSQTRDQSLLPRALPIKSIKIDTKISSQVATTHVEQVFRNDTKRRSRARICFRFPSQLRLPSLRFGTAIGVLLVKLVRAKKRVASTMKSCGANAIPDCWNTPAKILFQASIFPILPHSDKKLEITYTQVVRAEGGTVAYRYPLGTGRQLAQIGSVAGRIEVESKDPLRNVYSPTHAIDVKRNSDKPLSRFV